ncbi:MAG: DUF2141 domain-containing protein [Desulfobacteraceae bacterium]|nr:MAG: DUF2141 domain-containing protein [Desulfobacteraceae bacterium]
MRSLVHLIGGPDGLIVFLVLLVSLVSPDVAASSSGDIRVTISGFGSNQGVAKVALMNSRTGFETGEIFKGVNLAIQDNQSHAVFKDLPYGDYAVQVFHDENGNDKLDTRIFGIPVERYGFSNNARDPFGPPDYEQARFSHQSNETAIRIEIK